MKNNNTRVYYKDFWIALLGVPLINALNYYLTYPKIGFDGYLALTYSVDTLTGYAAWYACRRAIDFLDGYFSWERGILKRMAIQVPAVCLVLLAVIILETEVVNRIATDHPVPSSFYSFDIFIFLIWGIFLNFLYLSLYLVYKFRSQEKSRTEFIVVRIGKQRIQINLSRVRCFFLENENVYALHGTDKQNAAGYTLDQLELMAGTERFFRANRQFLVGREVIKSLKSEENGKLSLWFVPDERLPDFIMVSRLRAPALRQWLENR